MFKELKVLIPTDTDLKLLSDFLEKSMSIKGIVNLWPFLVIFSPMIIFLFYLFFKVREYYSFLARNNKYQPKAIRSLTETEKNILQEHLSLKNFFSFVLIPILSAFLLLYERYGIDDLPTSL